VHDDGRTSFPLVFIFYCPKGINTKLNILYASTKPVLTESLQVQKVGWARAAVGGCCAPNPDLFSSNARSFPPLQLFSVATTEELTESWLKDKLAFFK
jgi:hypothetical protein